MPIIEDSDYLMAAQEIYGLTKERAKYGRTDYMQDVLGPMEHKAFVRETTRRNPLQGLAVTAGAPAYTAAKALGLTKARSRASVDEIFAAGEGFGQGMKDYFRGRR